MPSVCLVQCNSTYNTFLLHNVSHSGDILLSSLFLVTFSMWKESLRFFVSGVAP